MGQIGPGYYGNLIGQLFQQVANAGGLGDALAAQGNGNSVNSGFSPAQSQLAGLLLLDQLVGMRRDISAQQMSQLIKQMMALPEDIQTLLSQLASGTSDKSLIALKTLLAENPQASITGDAMQSLIGKNAQDAMQKLTKMLTTNQMGYSGESQSVSDLLRVMAQLGKAAQMPAVDTLKTVMLMYIPWYPLAAEQRLDLHLEWGGSEDQGSGEDGDDVVVVMYLETVTLGSWIIRVGLQEGTQCVFKVQAPPVAETLWSDLQKECTRQLAEDGLPAPVWKIEWLEVPKSNQNKTIESLESPTNIDPQPKLSIFPNKGVSVITLNAAYRLVRLIFEADERGRTHANREAVNQQQS
ncbi:MAG: hypothetical protein K2X01_01070 [Cyanobacteria bacterium]|nr:hypothetical protein [Cyanobacteriota bacterium]